MSFDDKVKPLKAPDRPSKVPFERFDEQELTELAEFLFPEPKETPTKSEEGIAFRAELLAFIESEGAIAWVQEVVWGDGGLISSKASSGF